MIDIHLGPVDQPVGFMQSVDGFRSDAIALQAHDIDTTDLRRITVDKHEGRDVVDNPRLPAHETEPADRGVMVDSDTAGKARVAFHVDVPAQHRAVCNRDPIAELAVVSHVRSGHQEVMATQAGHPIFLLRPSVDCHAFTNNIVVTDLNPSRRAMIRHVLRITADDDEGANHVVFTNCGDSHDADLRNQLGSPADLDVGADHAVGTDLDSIRDFSIGVNMGCIRD